MRIRKQWSPLNPAPSPPYLSESLPSLCQPQELHLRHKAAAAHHFHQPTLLLDSLINQEDSPNGAGEEDGAAKENGLAATNLSIGYNIKSSETPAGSSFSISSSLSHEGHWCEEDKLFPLKKRRVILKCNATTMQTEKKKYIHGRETIRSNKKWVDDVVVKESAEQKRLESSGGKIMEANSLCHRTSSRGWRCCRPTLMGYSWCEYHSEQRRKWVQQPPTAPPPPPSIKLRPQEFHTSLYLKNWCFEDKYNEDHNNDNDNEDEDDDDYEVDEDVGKKRERSGGKTLMEVEGWRRCSRRNGKGWRCCEPTLEGYSSCEHHLVRSRKINMKKRSQQRTATTTIKQQKVDTHLCLEDTDDEEDEDCEDGGNGSAVGKRREKIRIVKARSMSSLLSQTHVPSPRPLHG